MLHRCDAFDSDNKVKQSSMAFEKANLAFNLASLCSRIATAKVPGEGTYASMAQHYQAAGSVFSWMSETFLHPPLVDLQAASLRFLSCLMLAQAQECVLLKAVSEGKMSGTLSRLAAALTVRYERCSGLLQSPEGQSLAASLSHGCRTMTEGKALYYGALSSQWRADACADGDGHGEAVARQLRAVHLFERLAELDAESGLFGDVDSLVEAALKRHERLEHENGFIYHLAVPDTRSLPSLDAADLTRCLGFRDVLCELGIDRSGAEGDGDLFRRVLPQRALEELSRYSEEKAKILRYETCKAEAADEELDVLRMRLCSLESSTDGTSASPARQLQAQIGTIPSVEEALRTAKEQMSQARMTLERCALLRIEDQRHQQAMKGKYGPAWTLAPLVPSGEDYQARVEAVEAEMSKLGEGHVRHVAQPLAMLLDRVGRLESASSSSLLDGHDDVDGAKREMKAALDSSSRLGATRASLIARLKDAISQDDISDRLLPQQQKGDELFQEELRKFDSLCDGIEANVAEHLRLKAIIDGLLADEERRGSRSRQCLGLDELERSSAAIHSAASQLLRSIEYTILCILSSLILGT